MPLREPGMESRYVQVQSPSLESSDEDESPELETLKIENQELTDLVNTYLQENQKLSRENQELREKLHGKFHSRSRSF